VVHGASNNTGRLTTHIPALSPCEIPYVIRLVNLFVRVLLKLQYAQCYWLYNLWMETRDISNIRRLFRLKCAFYATVNLYPAIPTFLSQSGAANCLCCYSFHRLHYAPCRTMTAVLRCARGNPWKGRAPRRVLLVISSVPLKYVSTNGCHNNLITKAAWICWSSAFSFKVIQCQKSRSRWTRKVLLTPIVTMGLSATVYSHLYIMNSAIIGLLRIISLLGGLIVIIISSSSSSRNKWLWSLPLRWDNIWSCRFPVLYTT